MEADGFVVKVAQGCFFSMMKKNKNWDLAPKIYLCKT
jgi:hypothetical protein